MRVALLDDTAIILVRLAVLALLYLFLAAVLQVVWRDLAAAAPARRGSVGRAVLVVEEGTARQIRPGDRLPIEGAASIGRDSDNQVVIDDATVSGRHAALVFREGRWWIEDLGSTNGTWLAGQQVQGREPVASGTLIQIGRVSLRLH